MTNLQFYSNWALSKTDALLQNAMEEAQSQDRPGRPWEYAPKTPPEPNHFLPRSLVMLLYRFFSVVFVLWGWWWLC